MTSGSENPSGLDGLVERAGRWTAARTTRRSFLGRVGRTALVVAAGGAASTLLAEPAGARVCGQTGVSLACPDFDCTDVWGWCWYSTGCCAGGLLKKICDCCARDFPNVHGYCPTGHNVKCIVESCGEDPRVQRLPIARITSDNKDVVADFVRRRRSPAGNGTIVIGDGEDPLFSAVATALSGALGAALLLVARKDLSPGAVAEIQRLGAATAVIAGPLLPPVIDAVLSPRGIFVHRPGTSTEVGPWSGEVATWLSERASGRDAVVTAAGADAEVRAVAAAFAGAIRAPLIIGADHALGRPAAGTGAGTGTAYLIGPETAARADAFTGAVAFGQVDIVDLALSVATLASSDPRFTGEVVFVPRQSPVALNLAALAAPLVVHEHNDVARVTPWAKANRLRLRSVVRGGLRGSLGSSSYRLLQSALNGYDVDQLIGVAGQGLPVYSQPMAERPIGAARLGTDPPPARLAARTWGNAGRIP